MKPERSDIKRYQENWRGEMDGVFLYRSLSESEKNPQLAQIYLKLSETERHHVKFWATKLKEIGVSVPEYRPGIRSRVLSFLAKRFGPGFILPSLATIEKIGSQNYTNQPETKSSSLPQDERKHARMLEAITQDTKMGIEGRSVAKLEGRHHSIGGNALRAAVLGVNDGLVSNLSLIMGVAGASLPNKAILVTGFAGLLAGASSMAMGEWLSVQSSRELYLKQIGIEEAELSENPKEEEAELALIYQAKGVPQEDAERLAASIFKDPKNAIKALSREELGIDPDSLGGSAWEAAFTSFILFCAGAIVPILPFFIWKTQSAVIASLFFSAAALFLVGAMITLLTGRGVFRSGFRQLWIGLTAALITYGLGRLLGAVLS